MCCGWFWVVTLKNEVPWFRDNFQKHKVWRPETNLTTMWKVSVIITTPTTTQPQHGSWVGHKNDFPHHHHHPPTTNSKLFLTQFWPNFKGRFLGSTTATTTVISWPDFDQTLKQVFRINNNSNNNINCNNNKTNNANGNYDNKNNNNNKITLMGCVVTQLKWTWLVYVAGYWHKNNVKQAEA